MVVLAESAQSTVPPAIACDAPAASGALDCDAIWPAVNATGQNSSLILLEVREMMDQVDAVTCVEYVSGGQWKGTDLNTYDGVSRIDSESWYNADGTWAGGFDANTLRDECSAMACFDCFCKTRVASLVLIGVGFTEDTDGYYALCETYFAGKYFLYHIPPTYCPYETDIYFYNLRAVLRRPHVGVHRGAEHRARYGRSGLS